MTVGAKTIRWMLASVALTMMPISVAFADDDPGFFPGGPKAYVKECRAKFAEVDARIKKAGVREASYYQVPDYPYLRSSRLLAAYTDDLDSPEKYETWLYQLRDNDGFAREIELRNLGMTSIERSPLLQDLRTCAVWMSNFELNDPPDIKKLFKAVQVPDDTGSAVSVPDSVPSAPKPSSKNEVLWQAKKNGDGAAVVAQWSEYQRDDLGRIGMTPSDQLALVQLYAPNWLIEKRNDKLDIPGAAAWRGDKIVIDGETPVVYYHPSFARIDYESYLQLNYLIFFSQNGEPGAPVDGVIWRVTLDHKGKPLTYDTIRASGGEHKWFPAHELNQRSEQDGSTPQQVSQEPVGGGPLAVQLYAKPYHVGAVQASEALQGYKPESYELRPYEELFLLSKSKDSDTFHPDSKSMFNGQGVIAGTQDADAPANKVRQWGHHRLGDQSGMYFDAPDLIERHFNLEKLAKSERRNKPHGSGS